MPRYAARRMGLPIARAGDRHQPQRHPGALLRDRRHDRSSGVEPSLSPSMDIQVSSNFERLLFELLGPRRRGGGRRRSPNSAAPARCRRREPAMAHGARAVRRAAASTTRPRGRRSPRPCAQTGEIARSPHRHRRGGGAGRPARPRRADGGAGHRPSRQIPRCGRSAPPGSVRRCRARLADLLRAARAATDACQRSRRASRAIVRDMRGQSKGGAA